jgi:tetratricopeptide (TPR) repeat protein
VQTQGFEKQLFWTASLIVAVLTVIWCFWLGAWKVEKTSLALATSSAAFAVGSLVGFIFTIFGEELEPLGKIRDAMIALASGIAGVSIAKVGSLGLTLGRIQLLGESSSDSQSFSVLFVLVYFVSGFYFMYLMRKLVLNPALAKSRLELDRIQISGNVALVAMELGNKLPQSLLLGRESIEEIVEDGGKQSEELRAGLFSKDVEEFLAICDQDLKAGARLQMDTVAKAAVLHYYRIYFKKEDADRDRQQELAIEWINRALLRDPLESTFWIKLADVFAMQDRYEEAVAILQRLERDEDAPQYVQQWLGYFLLFMDGRESDSIRQSLEFHRRFPDESAGLFNAACGYAQLYESELRQGRIKEKLDSHNRSESLRILEDAIRIDPENKAYARKYAKPDDSFACLAEDADFLRITTEPQHGARS